MGKYNISILSWNPLMSDKTLFNFFHNASFKMKITARVNQAFWV